MKALRSPSLLALLACTTGILANHDAHAQRFPERPLRVIMPFPPGSAPDNVTRILGPQITANTGQAVVVDSRPGAAGTLATDLGAKATPDGYSITFAVLGPVGLAPSLYAKLPYNPVTDFAPVTLIAFAPQILMTSPSAPFKSVKELIALARAKPGQLNYASAGKARCLICPPSASASSWTFGSCTFHTKASRRRFPISWQDAPILPSATSERGCPT